MATTTLGEASVLLVNAVDISQYLDTVTFTTSGDVLDISTFTFTGHRKRGGLTNGNIAIGGVYDTTTGGPHDVLFPLLNTVVAFDWRPEGTGVGKPKTTGSVLVSTYVESAPVADIVRWTSTLEIDGAFTTTNQ